MRTAAMRQPAERNVASRTLVSIFLMIMCAVYLFIPLVNILPIIRDMPDAPLPTVEAADDMPDVEMIHVEMLGTVSMVSAPITKVPITMPKDRTPLLAKAASFSMSARSEEHTSELQSL